MNHPLETGSFRQNQTNFCGATCCEAHGNCVNLPIMPTMSFYIGGCPPQFIEEKLQYIIGMDAVSSHRIFQRTQTSAFMPILPIFRTPRGKMKWGPQLPQDKPRRNRRVLRRGASPPRSGGSSPAHRSMRSKRRRPRTPSYLNRRNPQVYSNKPLGFEQLWF